MKYGKIYLIPTPIIETNDPFLFMPLHNREVMQSINYYVVENIRSARRFISKAETGKVIDTLHFEELNEHTDIKEIPRLLEPILKGESCGIMSEAGVPGVADPGADLVAAAHSKGIEVVPLVGPSSIIMSLMASGLNGQSFAFNGYLPIKNEEKSHKIKELERRAITQNQSQIFIEAPYRNDKMFSELISVCQPNTKICVAVNISAQNQYIKTFTAKQWRDLKEKPMINKLPAIFIIGT